MMSWRNLELSFSEKLELKKMRENGYDGIEPENRGEFRDIWEEWQKKNSKFNSEKNLVIDLYHMSSIYNLESILIHGILSPKELEKHGIKPNHISDREIVKKRKNITIEYSTTLADCAQFYFQPRNAMLYRLMNEKEKEKVIILRFYHDIFDGGYFSSANATTLLVTFNRLDSKNKINELTNLTNLINKKSWGDDKRIRQKMMAEVLIPKKLDKIYLKEIICSSDNMINQIQRKIGENSIIDIKCDKEMFFL